VKRGETDIKKKRRGWKRRRSLCWSCVDGHGKQGFVIEKSGEGRMMIGEINQYITIFAIWAIENLGP